MRSPSGPASPVSGGICGTIAGAIASCACPSGLPPHNNTVAAWQGQRAARIYGEGGFRRFQRPAPVADRDGVACAKLVALRGGANTFNACISSGPRILRRASAEAFRLRLLSELSRPLFSRPCSIVSRPALSCPMLRPSRSPVLPLFRIPERPFVPNQSRLYRHCLA